MTDWFIDGTEFGNCNCSYGCPCQFEALPTHGHCKGFEVLRIERGSFGDVSLSGLNVAMLYAWPGPIAEGNGEMQIVLDQRATAEQRESLLKVLMGEETEPGATHWWVYREMSSRVHEPLIRPIAFEVNIEARTARVDIPGVLQSTGRPIKGATGREHRVRIVIPQGIEFEEAEVGSASTTSSAAIKLNLQDTFGQFNILRHSRKGVVHS
jgi:hypothetical protein